MPVYNKLVRDKIPEIIEKSGKQLRSRVLEAEEYKSALQEKCLEEWDEYLKAETSEHALEELADLLEIIHALAKIHGGTPEQLEKIRMEKAVKRGGFEKRLFLIEVMDED